MIDKLLLVFAAFLAFIGLVFVYNIFVNLPLLRIDYKPGYAPIPFPKVFSTFFVTPASTTKHSK